MQYVSSDNQDKVRYPDEQVSGKAMADVRILGHCRWRGGFL